MSKSFPPEFLQACMQALFHQHVGAPRSYSQYLDYWAKYLTTPKYADLEVRWIETEIGDDAVFATLGRGSRMVDIFQHVHGNEWIDQLWVTAMVEAAQREPKAFRDLGVTFRISSLDGDAQRVQRTNRSATLPIEAFEALVCYTDGMSRSFYANDKSAMFPGAQPDPARRAMRMTPEVELAMRLLETSRLAIAGHHAHVADGVYRYLPLHCAKDDYLIGCLDDIASRLSIPSSTQVDRLESDALATLDVDTAANVVVTDWSDGPRMNPGRSLHRFGLDHGVNVEITEYAPFLFRPKPGCDARPGEPPVAEMQQLKNIACLKKPSLSAIRRANFRDGILMNERRLLTDALEAQLFGAESHIDPLWSAKPRSPLESFRTFYGSIQVGQAARLAMYVGEPKIARALEAARLGALRYVADSNYVTHVPPLAVALGQMLSAFACMSHELNLTLDLNVAAPYLNLAAKSQVPLLSHGDLEGLGEYSAASRMPVPSAELGH